MGHRQRDERSACDRPTATTNSVSIDSTALHGVLEKGPVSPYARFQLFRNPFGELTSGERAQLAVIDLDLCLAQLQHSRAVLQVLGPCGHGKTTHLLAIQQATGDGADDRDNYVYFPEDGAQPILPEARPLFVDEAQRLSRRRRRQLLSGEGPLILGTHVDLAAPLRRAKFIVHTLDLSKPLDATTLQELLNRRILASRISSGSLSRTWEHASERPSSKSSCMSSAATYHPLCLTLAQVVALQGRFGSNIRRIEHYLYDAFQCFAEKGGPWLPVN